MRRTELNAPMLRKDTSVFGVAAAATMAAALLAACSSNAGFGGAPPYQNGAPNPTPFAGNGSPFGGTSPEAAATPETTLTVDSASARVAYDAYAADPVKAPRLVEVTFALNNPEATPMPVSDVAIAPDNAPTSHVALALQALPEQDTVETLVAIAPPKDPSKTKQIKLTFSDGKGAMLASSTVDYPTAADPTMTSLDKKRPNGALTIDDISITTISAPGPGLHYDLTFSATNASQTDAAIAYFTVTPPKSGPNDVPGTVKIAVPIKLPARTEMSAISIVVPYSTKAKTLPSGKYVVEASDGKSTLAQGSGPLL